MGNEPPASTVILPLARTVLVLLLSLLTASPGAAEDGRFPVKLTLERVLPSGLEMEELRARDRARHSRLLQASSSPAVAGVVDFFVHGSSNPSTAGLYYTRVKLGNPPKEFYVQIDTGSDLFWVTCNPCSGCPKASGLDIQLEFFNPNTSSTASMTACSDEWCSFAMQNAETGCLSDSQNSLCGYFFQYQDGSSTSGYYVSDTLYFDTVIGDKRNANSSATVIFGCSYSQSGELTRPDIALDGIFGFGQNDLSVISQLSSRGVVPKVFSHCLKGSDNGGGILVLGEILEPGIVYTPLVQSMRHYSLNLQSIAVNGQILPIDSSVFSASSTQGTIVDSGTTLAYLTKQAYDPFINAITASLSPSIQSIVSQGDKCFVSTSSVDEIFPSVTLNFEGAASMVLKPQDYLLQKVSIDNSITWCIGWQENQGLTILGDIVLKDKIFVYDLAGQRVGWTNYDCSLSINVTTSSTKNEFLDPSLPSFTGSSYYAYYNLLSTSIAVCLVHTSVFALL